MYQIGSTTKAFTALALLMLEDEGRISLENTVSKYILNISFTYEGKEAEITIN